MFGILNLDFGVYLEFGVWDLEFRFYGLDEKLVSWFGLRFKGSLKRRPIQTRFDMFDEKLVSAHQPMSLCRLYTAFRRDRPSGGVSEAILSAGI